MRAFATVKDLKGAPCLPQGGAGFTYVYALLDPRDSSVRYVGVSSDPKKRLGSHLARPTSGAMREWLRDLLAEKLEPVVWMVGKCDASKWEDAEKALIAYLKSRWVLYNVHPGGLIKGTGVKPGTRFREVYWEKTELPKPGDTESLTWADIKRRDNKAHRKITSVRGMFLASLRKL